MSVIIGIIVLAVLVYLAIRVGVIKLPSALPRGKQSRGVRNGSALTFEQSRRKWAQIEELLALGKPSALRTAVVEADKLFDAALLAKGYHGTWVERMKAAQSKFSDSEALWRAHKLRNVIVHEVSYDLVVSTAHEAVGGFKKGLKELGML